MRVIRTSTRSCSSIISFFIGLNAGCISISQGFGTWANTGCAASPASDDIRLKNNTAKRRFVSCMDPTPHCVPAAATWRQPPGFQSHGLPEAWPEIKGMPTGIADETNVSCMGSQDRVRRQMRVDREVALRPLGRNLKHAQTRQQLFVVLGQPGDLPQMIGPVFH